jgi:putative SOS response-associated peptidase YedK
MAKWLAALWMKVWQNGKCLIKNQGFITWRKLAVYDTDMPKTTISNQKQKMEALAAIMDGYSSTDFH